MRRAEKLDIQYTDDLDETPPFAEALKNKFNSGGVHPLVLERLENQILNVRS